MINVSEVNPLSLIIALLAGLLSFISPCVLPLVPVYLGYMSGTSASELRTTTARREFNPVMPTLAFIFGLAIVFVLLGATATTAGRLFADFQGLIVRIGGLAVIVFGLNMAGVIRIPWLYRTVQGDIGRARKGGLVGAALLGATFGAGWIPCVGPFLASILALASQERTAEQGMVLLLFYALGLGIPFLLVSVAWRPAMHGMTWMKQWSGTIEMVSGLLLVVLGCLLVTDQYSFIAGRLTQLFGVGLAL
jgi:cytochrome c-type biogenesis protein